jgi:hypothetical protein
MAYEDYQEAWNVKTPESRAKAKTIAEKHIKDDPAAFKKYESLSLEELVALVDLHRAGGNEDERRRIDVWLLAKHPPQQIGGVLTPNQG